MRRDRQRGDGEGVMGIGLRADLRSTRRPLWLRLIALSCLLFVLVMSSAQVCHVHSDSLLLKGNSRQGDPTPTPDDHCPLCVAMHSALPVVMHVQPQPLLSMHLLEMVGADAHRVFRWRFELASRPPPGGDLSA